MAMRLGEVLDALKRRGTKDYEEGLARYGIVAPRAFGVSVGDIQAVAKQTGRDHALANALWKSGWYEARMLVAFVAEPDRVTPADMERWTRDFDNWAICDALCFHLYDKTPHAWKKIAQWSRRKEEFVKRAAFATLAALAGHDRATGDAPFLKSLALIERAAPDPRNFVKKGVSWALRGVGHRSPVLHAAAVKLSRKLAKSPEPAARWVGKDALRDLLRPMVVRKVNARRARQRSAGPPG